MTRRQQMLAQVYPVLKGEIDTDPALTQVIKVILISSEQLLAVASLFSRP